MVNTMREGKVMARWAFALLALLLACGESVPVEPVPAQPVQTALAPTPTLAPTRVPITAPPTPVVPTTVPTPTALPTPPPTPTPSPQFVSTDGIVYSAVEIPRPQFDEALRDELVLQNIEGTWLPYSGLASLEETILEADVIARVSLVSTRTSWSKRPHDTIHIWGALLEFRFRVHEYLKGTGPDEIGGIVYIDYATSEADARAGMAGIAAAHDSRWDSREAVVFLRADDWDLHQFPAYPVGAGQYFFGLMALSSAEFYDDLDDAYTVGSRYRKLWLPEATAAASSSSGSTARSTTEKIFLLDAPATTTATAGASGGSARSATQTTATAPTISLSSMRSKIAALEAEANAGGTPAYRDCVESTYIHWRLTTHQVRTKGTPLKRYDVTIASGQPAGTVIHETYAVGTTTLDLGTIYWYDGADKDVVRPEITGTRPERISSYPKEVILTVGHVTTRPLPSGDYTFFTNGSHPACNLRFPNAHNHRVVNLTVTAPERTLHEAFFDPVAIGTAVGADGSNGVLKPASFSLDGTTTTISSLKWEDGIVTMALSPTITLAAYAIDFIDATGTTTLSLSSDNASTTALT